MTPVGLPFSRKMKKEDNIQITINIAGQRIPLTVGFDQQNLVRETERSVDDLYEKWRVKFPRKSMQELLAMIAYQYASFYLSLSRRIDDASREASLLDDELSRLLKESGEES